MKAPQKVDGMLDALRIVGVAQGLCLKGIRELERTVRHLATEVREGFATLEDIVVSRPGCARKPFRRGKVPKPRARLRKEVSP